MNEAPVRPPDCNLITSLSCRDLLMESALVDGEWRESSEAAATAVRDPETGSVDDDGGEDVRNAIDVAAATLPKSKSRLAASRSVLLQRWHALKPENVDDLARIMMAEQGEPLAEAANEIPYPATIVNSFAEEEKRVQGHDIPRIG